MADYLQPGGARYKFTNSEKQEFIFKTNKLEKKIIADCILEAINPKSDVMKCFVLCLLIIESYYLHEYLAG